MHTSQPTPIIAHTENTSHPELRTEAIGYPIILVHTVMTRIGHFMGGQLTHPKSKLFRSNKEERGTSSGLVYRERIGKLEHMDSEYRKGDVRQYMHTHVHARTWENIHFHKHTQECQYTIGNEISSNTAPDTPPVKEFSTQNDSEDTEKKVPLTVERCRSATGRNLSHKASEDMNLEKCSYAWEGTRYKTTTKT